MSSEKIVMTGYYRVSTKAESQRSSFEAQPAYFRTLLSLPQYKNYVPADEFYFDYGTSGTKLNRPGFQKMLEDAGLDVEVVDKDEIDHPNFPGKKMRQRKYIVSVSKKKKPKFEEIWIKNTSRFARNINAYEILEVLQLAHVYVYFIDLNLTTRNDNHMPAIRKRLDEDMAYSEQISRNRKIVQIQYEQENRISGCPIGFVYHKKNYERLPYYTIDPVYGPAVQKMYQYCIDGLGMQAISDKLANEGILAPNGKPFATSTIRRTLLSEKNMGLNTCGKYTTGPLFNKLDTPKVRDDYSDRLIPHEGIPQLVTPEIWHQAIDAMSERKTNKNDPHSKGIKPVRHSYKDLLVCGYCGNHFTYDNNSGNGFYQCSTKSNQGMDACQCINVYSYKLDDLIQRLSNGELHAIITTDFENTIISLLTLAEAYIGKFKNPLANTEREEELQNLKAQAKIKEEKIALLLSSFSSDDGTLAASIVQNIQKTIEEINNDLISLNHRINDLETPPIELANNINHLFDVITKSFEVYSNKKEKYTKEEVLSLLKEIRVFEKTKQIGGKMPEPALIPILKTTEEAQGLIEIGCKEFKYKLENSLPNYEAPEHFIQTRRKTKTVPDIHPFDDENLTAQECSKLYCKETKSNWPFSEGKYILNTHAFGREDGSLGYVPNLGFENLTVMQQLKEYADQLYQEFLDAEKQCQNAK